MPDQFTPIAGTRSHRCSPYMYAKPLESSRKPAPAENSTGDGKGPLISGLSSSRIAAYLPDMLRKAMPQAYRRPHSSESNHEPIVLLTLGFGMRLRRKLALPSST